MKFKSEYIGIILGALYGLFIRFLSEIEYIYEDTFSVVVILVVPVVIGVIPIIFSQTNIYKNRKKVFFYPILAVLLYLLFAFLTRLEDLVCVLIIGAPAIIVAGILGLIIGAIVKKRMNDKKIYSIVLLPFILVPVENMFPIKTEIVQVESSIVINNQPENIFPNLLQVPTISKEEYQEGVFQYIGIPRPIESKIISTTNQIVRIGKFTDNLELYEFVSAIEENKFVNFKIDIEKSKLRQTPTDQHVLKGDYFKFENINYTIIPINSAQSTVILSCDYRISSRLNWYGRFWSERIIQDFEKRLLKSLKLKLESP